MDKKRLLIVAGNFCLEAGGIENTSYLFAEFFRTYFEVITFSSHNSNRISIDGVKSYYANYPHNKLRNSIRYINDSYKVIKSIHEEKKIDYILCTHYGYADVIALFSRKNKVPFGVLTHGNDVYSKWKCGSIKNLVNWFFTVYLKRKYVLDNANTIYSNTHYTCKLVKKLTNNPNVIVINPPIGVVPTKDNEPIDNHYILSLGRIVERKGYQLVLKALPEVLKIHPNLKYVIAGCGEYEPHLREITADLCLENNVIFKGRVSEEEKNVLMRECSVFILPSLEIPNQQTVEGFGLSLLEANAYGKFVISSRSGGIPEAVDNCKTGYLVKENDVDSIYKALIKVFDKDFKYNRQYCIQWAMRCHISEIVSQYNKVIEKSFII